ncbi:MAG: AAA family ATPase [Candidatus Eremiobacteraeota bacterium]|nr:AAA family ATPase [Candidatus Eremiobacteraeota bacterium]MBV8222913.1 AAA family ATPase [Candidatus Eremiobacteraeota bacterium]MBV8282714.1 AAA family ATPase [Candidatus Eremiobacteraeota bacterium]
MLLDAFGLQRDPFADTADPAFYFETMANASNRRRLYECLAQGRGLAVVLGPVGAGKTSLFNAVTARLLEDPRFLVGLILDPTFADEAQLLAAIIASLGFAALARPNATPRELREHLKRQLFEATVPDGRQAILLVDEAQLLPDGLLESLRALLNFQLDDRKLLSIGLAGQEEISSAILRRPNLSDRVAVWLDIGPLTEAESAGLIEHRLRRAGYAGDRSPFSIDALHELWERSGGLPRRLGSHARESMEVAAERASRQVTSADVVDASRRLPPASQTNFGRPHGPRRPWWQVWKVAG